MAAPTALPSHHVKGEVAENRPAYREGRIPKATKVKTLHFNHKLQEIKNTGFVPWFGSRFSRNVFIVHGFISSLLSYYIIYRKQLD